MVREKKGTKDVKMTREVIKDYLKIGVLVFLSALSLYIKIFRFINYLFLV